MLLENHIQWMEARIVLQNTYSTTAKEHPLFVFDAIFKYAAHENTTQKAWPEPVYFRPLEATGNGIVFEKKYPLRLIFPQCQSEEKVRTVLDCIAKRLTRERSHFSLVERGEPEEYELSRLLAESRFHKNVCLKFISPLSYEAKEEGWKGNITAEPLCTLFLRRIERLFGSLSQKVKEQYLEEARTLRILPWFLKYTKFCHSTKSQPGCRYLCGLVGNLFLENVSEAVHELLVLGSQLNIGSRLFVGQGAYELTEEKPFIDRQLEEKAFWERVWQEGNETAASAENIARLCRQEKEEPLKKTFGLGLFRLLHDALTRADASLHTQWKEAAPTLPPQLLPYLLALLPAQDTKTADLLAYLAQDQKPEQTMLQSEPVKPLRKRKVRVKEKSHETIYLEKGACLSLVGEQLCKEERLLWHLQELKSLVVYGEGSVALGLIRACTEKGIPLVPFCPPQTALFQERSAMQLRHWDWLGEKGRKRIAKEIGQAVGQLQFPQREESFFKSSARKAQADPWNVLLDTASSIFSARLLALIYAEGLCPSYGFLFPTLTQDLEALFQQRVYDALVRIELEEKEFCWQEGKWVLSEQGYFRIYSFLKKELDTAWLQEIEEQVCAFRRWICGEGELVLAQR